MRGQKFWGVLLKFYLFILRLFIAPVLYKLENPWLEKKTMPILKMARHFFN